MDYKIDFARNARLGVVSKYSENVIKLAMEHAGISQVIITSTLRTIEDQARIMYHNVIKWTRPPHNLTNLDAIRKKRELTYTAPGTTVDEVCWANRSKTELEVRGLMEAKIKEYLKKGQRTSLHCVSIEEYEKLNVIDISFISGTKAEDFERILQSMSKRIKSSKKYKEIAGFKKVIQFLYREKGCWHIEIPQENTKPDPTNEPFVIPVKIAGVDDNRVTTGTVEKLYEHTEKANIHGGFFPLGVNSVWHGGVHLHVSQRSDVVAMTGGEVIAVKLAESENKAIGHYGSHNFILMKHEITGKILNAQFQKGSEGDEDHFNESDKKVFYSLYMHLKNEVLDPDVNPKLNQIKWLPRAGTEMKEEHVIVKGETLEKIADKWDTTVDKIRAANPELESHYGDTKGKSWYYPGDRIKRPTEGAIDQKFLNSLKSGEVIKVQNTVLKTGELLWTTGIYGNAGVSAGVVHWEIFSEDNLFPSFTKAEDNVENWNMDSSTISNVVDPQNQLALSSADDLKRLHDYYQKDPKAAELRRFACKFISEWAVDVDKGLEDIKKVQELISRKVWLEPYQWWSKAVEKGVTLPSSRNHWHYNPISFISMLMRKPSAESCNTSWKNGFNRNITDQNMYNDYITEAATQYNIDCKILKSLIAQESSFNPKASNSIGYAGLTQVGGPALVEAGFNIGKTSNVTGKWVYDISDERFDPMKSIIGGAKILSKKRLRIDNKFLTIYKSSLTSDEQWAFYLAAYNAGEKTISDAYKYSGKETAKWSDLIKGGCDSPLYSAIPVSWGRDAKYKEITEYVDNILKRKNQI